MSEDSRMAVKRHALFEDMVGVIERTLEEHEVQAALATIAATALADRLADHWGGQNIVFPKDYRRKLTRRELDIYDEFRGNNISELARKHNVAERSVRRIIDRIRRRIQAGQSANQIGLLDAN